jgi:hypothetical protein
MILKGELDDFNIGQLLNVINLAQKTGTLRLFGEEAIHVPAFVGMIQAYPEEVHGRQAEVYFRSGTVLSAATTHTRNDLVSVLRRTGKLNDRQMETIRERYKGLNDKRMAVQLIAGKYVSKDDITDAIRKHTIDIIHEVINWDRRHFEFVPDLPDFDDTVVVQINPDKIISTATRYVHERRQLEAQLPDLNQGLQFRDAAPDRLQNLTLTTEEWRVLGYVNPRNSLQAIGKACNVTNTELRRIVLRLREAGIIEFIEPPKTVPHSATPSSGDGLHGKVQTQVMQILRSVGGNREE